MINTDTFIGIRIKPEMAKKFNEITTKSGINKSFLMRTWINSYIEEKQNNTGTELMQDAV